MERLQLKVTRLENLWSCLGNCLDPLSIGDKLGNVLHELDKMIEYEEWRKKLLVADIEDVLTSIDLGCQILGISIESLLTSNINEGGMDELVGWEFYAATSVMEPTLERKNYLAMLNSKLESEIRQRRLHVKEWLGDIDAICIELDVSHSFGTYKSYYDELSWGTVQKISCTLRDLTQNQVTNKNRFECLASSIHYYRTVLGEPVNGDDPIDIALYNLCNTIIPDQDFDMNQPPSPLLLQKNADISKHCKKTFLYYRQPLPYPLSLKNDLLMNLQNKAYDLHVLYNIRYGQFNDYVNNIHTLWDELQIPNERRCTIHQSLHTENLDKLQRNSDEMKTIVHVMIDEYIATIRPTLESLWDKALMTKNERNEFLDALYQKANTMDIARAIMEKHMVYLEYLQPSSQNVDSIMKERKDLIQKMIDFESSASDPKRLFQASFQLIEEERWRKTCFPTLLQLDDALIKAVQEFEHISEKYFLVGNRRYLDMLMDEIADRTTNQTFFGFLNTEPNHDRPVRSKSRPNSLYTNSQSGSVSATTAIIANSDDNKKSKTLPLSESPSLTDIQQQTSQTNLKRRSLPNGTNKVMNAKDSTSIPPMPMPSMSTKPRRHQDTNKNRLTSSKSITTLATPNVIPQQYRSKSYQVSQSKSTLDIRQNNNDLSSKIGLDRSDSKKCSAISSTESALVLPTTQLQYSPPLSPISSSSAAPPPLPRSKASQIPIRKQHPQLSSTSDQSPSPTLPSASSSSTQQQQPTAQCV